MVARCGSPIGCVNCMRDLRNHWPFYCARGGSGGSEAVEAVWVALHLSVIFMKIPPPPFGVGDCTFLQVTGHQA